MRLPFPIVVPLLALAAPAAALEPGFPAEREIRGGETHEYRLSLQAGWYLRISAVQKEADVRLTLTGPGEETLAEADDPQGRVRPERLSILTTAAGAYRLLVVPHDPTSAAGTYRIEVEGLRPAAAGDPERVAAERLFAEGRLLLFKATEESKRQARMQFEQALASWRAAGDAAGQADALLELASIDVEGEHPEETLPRCKLALKLAQDCGYSRGSAQALLQIADFHARRRETDEAIASYEQALAIWEDLGDPAGAAAALYGIGLTLKDQGKTEEALAFLHRALPLRRRAGDTAREASTLTAIAGIHLDRGETGEALAGFDRALALSRAAGDARAEGSALFNLGIVHRRRGELEAALSSFEESLALNRRRGDRDNEPVVLHAQGSLYLDLGDSGQALARYREALELSRQRGDRGLEARTLTTIGFIHFLRGDLPEALDHYNRALALSQERKDTGGIAAALLKIGEVYTRLGRPREALPPLEETLSLRRQRGTFLEQAQVLLARGDAWRDLREMDRAADDFRQALELIRQAGSAAMEAECLYRWARLDRSARRPREALAKVREAIGQVESIRSRVVSQSLRTSYFAAKREYYEVYVQLLVELHEADRGQGYGAEALEASERARARALLDLLAEARIDLGHGIAPELKRRETDLEARLSWLQDQLLRNSSPDDPARASLREQLEQARSDLDRLEAEIRRQHPRYAEVRYPMPAKLAGIQGLLDEETALLEYFVGREDSFLFAATRDRLEVFRLPPTAEISAAVKSIRDVLRSRGRRQTGRFKEEARRLYEILVAPAAAVLAGKPRLLISPDGALHLLPFEALLTDAGGHDYRDLAYLLRRHAVTYIPSASILAGLREAQPSLAAEGRPKLLLAFAAPLYQGPEPRFAPLPEAEREARSIAGLYPADARAVYVGQEASEHRVKGDPFLGSARRLHFATHGLVEPRLRVSGLVLTPGGSPEEDGILHVHEIFNLRLSAELVALSACDTGLGEEIAGEGIVGMTRAFLYAGAHSLLVSFWPVLDGSTADLMLSFYRSIGSAGSMAEALRQAKLEMLADGQANPYYWAPFVLSGDPG